jgi:nitrate reductase NapAB chaperone NapD
LTPAARLHISTAVHYSGLLIIARPDRLEDCARQVAQCPGVEVYVREEASNRLVAVLETDSLQQQEDGLRRVQQQPAVAVAALVYHDFGQAREEEATECRRT